METIIICCRTLEKELEKALSETSCTYSCIWINSGLHNVPEKLTKELQKKLDELDDSVKRVILAFGYCGNSVKGLKTGNFELILPRAEDCITLILGSTDKRQQIMKESASYFLTKGWMDGERNIWTEYVYACDKYGEPKAKEIFKSMLVHYKRLVIIDTGAYHIPSILSETQNIADTLGLKHEIISGTDTFLKQLLTGPWPKERFLIVPPNGQIKGSDVIDLA